MFTDFLWLLGAKQQHDRQKELGLAGLVGLVLVIFMVWKWDSIFYPLFNKLGFVNFAERIGLISDLSIMTVINVLAVIFFLSLVFALVAFLLTVVGCLLMVAGSSERGKKLMGTALFVIFFPIIVVFFSITQYRYSSSAEGQASMRNTYKRDPNLKPLLMRYLEEPSSLRMFLLYKKQVFRDKTQEPYFNTVDAKLHLNRAVASIKTDRNWLIAYDEFDEQWYVLFPNPLPEFVSEAAGQNQQELKEAISKYPTYNVKGFFVDVGDRPSEGFFVPTLTIEFTWDKNKLKIEPRVTNDAKLIMKNTKTMYNYQIKNDDITTLFDVIAQRDDLYERNRIAHLLLYLIPIAYPPGVPFAADDHFNKAVQNIPYTDTYYPIYALDVRENLVRFAESGKVWAINWFAEPV